MLKKWGIHSEDRIFEQNIGFLVAIFILVSVNLLGLAIYPQYVRKAQHFELYVMLVEIKAFFHEEYGFNYKIPSEEKVNSFLEYHEYFFNSFNIELQDYYYQAGTFYLTLVDPLDHSKQKLLIKPVVDDIKYAIEWRCAQIPTDAQLDITIESEIWTDCSKFN